MARHPSRLLIPMLSLLALPALAGVEVFTTAGQPVVNVPPDAAVIELDAPARLDAQLSADLPADREQARQMALQRLEGKREALQNAAMGTARAWMIGVEKVPAVVVDSQFVIYGEADVATALEDIQAYRQAHDQEASPLQRRRRSLISTRNSGLSIAFSPMPCREEMSWNGDILLPG